MSYNYWEEEEIKKLSDFYFNGLRIKKISKIMGRSENSIQKGIKRFIKANTKERKKIKTEVRRSSFQIRENMLLRKINKKKHDEAQKKEKEKIYNKFYDEKYSNDYKTNSEKFLEKYDKFNLNLLFKKSEKSLKSLRFIMNNFKENDLLKKIDYSKRHKIKLIKKINVTTKEIKNYLESEGYTIKEKKIDSLPKNCNEKFFFFNNIMLSKTRIILIANGIRIQKREPIFYI